MRESLFIQLQNIKHNFKYRIRNYKKLYAFLRKFYHYLKFRLPERTSIIGMLRNFSENNNQIKFVQIGAYNGIDEFTELRRRYKWQGLLVEPQKIIFKDLVINTSGEEGIFLENVAVSDKPEVKKLYKLSLNVDWFSSYASFDRTHILRNLGWLVKHARGQGIKIPKNPEDMIVIEDVDCLPLNGLLVKYRLTDLDILIIDAEGYDFEIIRGIDFGTIKPKIIIFEYTNLSGNMFRHCKKLLHNNGYKLNSEELNVIAHK